MKHSYQGQQNNNKYKLYPHCTKNNYYRKDIDEKKATSLTGINQSIKKTPIDISSSNSSTSNNRLNYNQINHLVSDNIAKQSNQVESIVKSFSITSGYYDATFNKNDPYEYQTLFKYNINKKKALISALILLFTILLFVVPIIVHIIMILNGIKPIKFPNFIYFIIICFIGLTSLIVYCFAKSNLHEIEYEYILYDLKKKSAK